MQRCRLVTVGKIKMPWVAQGCADYLTRLRPLVRLEQVVLQAGTPAEEERRMLAALRKEDGVRVLLDESGGQMDSVAFSRWLEQRKDRSERAAFFIGGAYGFSDAVKAEADMLLSLSTMTFPHELAQLLFLEQLYRACSIMQGSGYHHGNA